MPVCTVCGGQCTRTNVIYYNYASLACDLCYDVIKASRLQTLEELVAYCEAITVKHRTTGASSNDKP
jgi:hypothetical protein